MEVIDRCAVETQDKQEPTESAFSKWISPSVRYGINPTRTSVTVPFWPNTPIGLQKDLLNQFVARADLGDDAARYCIATYPPFLALTCEASMPIMDEVYQQISKPNPRKRDYTDSQGDIVFSPAKKSFPRPPSPLPQPELSLPDLPVAEEEDSDLEKLDRELAELLDNP